MGTRNLLVIADATSQIADLGCETHLRRWGFVRTRPYKHVANLSDLTFRLLIGVIKFLTKRLAIGVLLGPGVHSNQLLGIGVADGTTGTMPTLATFCNSGTFVGPNSFAMSKPIGRRAFHKRDKDAISALR